MSAPELTQMQEEIASIIRDFPWNNFGMDDVGYAIEEDPEAQEWIPELARNIDGWYRGAQ